MDDATRLSVLARAAADVIEPGMLLGLGSGSTAEAVIREIGLRVAVGCSISGVATSERTARLARELKIPLHDLNDVRRLDLGIDGADEIDPELSLIKGRGGALLHEKQVALACDQLLIVAASEKRVTALGQRVPLPVEVIPFGWRQTERRLQALGCQPALRLTSSESDAPPFITDGGHYVVDCAFPANGDLRALGREIKSLTGVVEHGFFFDLAHRALLVDRDGVVHQLLAAPDSK